MPTAKKQADQITKLAADGVARKAVAERLNVSERSVHRTLEDSRRRLSSPCCRIRRVERTCGEATCGRGS
ncbi:helix-turn-helix domain-containing protein [Rubellimicrobium aerolatum]|uniref:Helix-turn-helix domain-containing protein n=1 Tax=Rubellimicrobium aerolatum TaxID=490979 RepID=A0ABW0S828_9RHOB